MNFSNKLNWILIEQAALFAHEKKNLFVEPKMSCIIFQLNNKNKFDEHDILFANAQSREDHLKEDEVQVR